MKRYWMLILALVLAMSAVSATVGEEGEFGTRSDGRIQNYSGTGGAVTVPAQVDGKPVYSIFRGTFEDNGTITELVFSEGLQSLGEAVTYGMSALEKVTLPETLIALDEANFTNCGKLTEITLPASLLFVGENCFNWCEILTSVTFRGPVPIFDRDCFYKTAKELVVYVPDDQLEAYRAALPEGLDIRPSGQNAVIPAHTVNLADFSFDMDSGTLTAYTGRDACVRVPGEIGGVPVRHIGDYAFEDNNFTYVVFLPEGVETLGYKAFATASALGWVDLPDSLKTIGESALSGYWGVGLHWPESLETIEADAFRSSNFSKSVRLPDRLKTIGSEAFAKSRLQEVEFPASLQSIGAEAFADSYVTKLYFGGLTLPQIDETAFEGLSITDVEINGKASDQALADAQAYLDSLGLNVQVRRGEIRDTEISQDGLENNGVLTGETSGTGDEPQPAPVPVEPDPAAGFIGVRYVCVSAETGGRTLDASMLGAEYAVTFHSDGTADFVLSGVPVPGLNWRMDGADAVIDYFGSMEIRFTIGEGYLTMDYFGSMLLRLEPEQ